MDVRGHTLSFFIVELGDILSCCFRRCLGEHDLGNHELISTLPRGMGTEQHPVYCVVRILGSMILATVSVARIRRSGLTRSGRETIDKSRMAMSRRELRLYRIGKGYCLVSRCAYPHRPGRQGQAQDQLTSSSISCTPASSAPSPLLHMASQWTNLINELSLT